jgi:hypothetical protein
MDTRSFNGGFTPLEIMPGCSAARLDFRIIPTGFNAPLEFLTGFAFQYFFNFSDFPHREPPVHINDTFSSYLQIWVSLMDERSMLEIIFDEVVKSRYFSSLSFLRKSRAPRDYFNGFWTPAFAGVTDFGLFTRPSYLNRVGS